MFTFYYIHLCYFSLFWIALFEAKWQLSTELATANFKKYLNFNKNYKSLNNWSFGSQSNSFESFVLTDHVLSDFNVFSISTTDSCKLPLSKVYLELQNWVNSCVASVVSFFLDINWIFSHCEVCFLTWFVTDFDAYIDSSFIFKDDRSNVVRRDETYLHWYDFKVKYKDTNF